MAKKKGPSATSPALDKAAEYTVLARRFRPQQFADLVGQEPVAQALMNALKSNRVAHAYLFTGLRGVGKTSAARILAKALNCEKGPTTTPCDQCEMCRAIMSGEDTDVLEIDGASNRRIEEIREIRSNVQFRPQRGRYKIYIIDEVHQLTKDAFNALLKTLEEPPPHVKFIFATTEAGQLPLTILSRCQRFDFVGIPLPQIVEHLRAIVKSEGMQADDDALELVARRAGGSMRDAQSLLDQLLAFGGVKLDVERVHGLLGTAHEDRVVELAATLAQRDAKQALAVLGKIVDQGQQLGELLDQLIEYWRDLMVVHFAGSKGQTLSVSTKHRAELDKQAKSLSPDSILAGLDVLITAKNRLRGTSHGRVAVEIALVRLCALENLVALGQLAQWLSKDGEGNRAANPTTAAMNSVRPEPIARPVAEVEKKKVEANADADGEMLPLRDENLPAILQQLIYRSGLTIGGEMRRITGVAISAPNTLVFQFPSRYNLRSDQVLEGERRTEVAALAEKITGQACQIRVEIVADAANGPVTGAGPQATESPGNKARRQRAEVLLVPLVKKALEVLGAQIVGVDEEFGRGATSPASSGAEIAEES